MEVKSLNKLDVKALQSALSKHDSFVFGSAASRTLSKKKTPIPKDVDIAVRDVRVFNKLFIAAIPKKFRRFYTIKGEKILRDGKPILDVKPIDRLQPNYSILSRRGYLPVSGYVKVLKTSKRSLLPYLSKKAKTDVAAFAPTQKIVKVGKIKLTGFGEQTTRKGLGTIQVLIEKNSRRAKDPQAFIRSLEIQLDALRSSKPKTPIGKVSKSRKIKTISNALAILKSKSFVKLLESKVKGISKDYPLLDKISPKKLSQAQKAIKNKPTVLPKKKLVLTAKEAKKAAKKRQPIVPKKAPSRLPSQLPQK